MSKTKLSLGPWYFACLLVAGLVWNPLFASPPLLAQTRIVAPKVFVDAAAQAFLSAMATARPSSTVPKTADVVVLVLDSKPLVHLVIVDLASGTKYWGILTLDEVEIILRQIGRSA